MIFLFTFDAITGKFNALVAKPLMENIYFYFVTLLKNILTMPKAIQLSTLRNSAKSCSSSI
jgi:hypothetical protein